MFNNYIIAKDELFYKKRFYNVLASPPLVVISLIAIYLLDFGLFNFVALTGITIMTLIIQFIYYYPN
ncbi:hypothetical protein COO05_22515 [Bacillus toyonensis]|uniref:hypothetical protein n=1 Tax=Bacillus toyonensis TaxID=155322 RepID=UPI000BEBEF22|nr:hypothetical protein [Bacillus toyonensis]PEB22367.1 hypothetical protein COO05_22515 [Bacillus toyonensis]